MIMVYHKNTIKRGIISLTLVSGLISTRYEPVIIPVAIAYRGEKLIARKATEIASGSTQNQPCREKRNRRQAAAERKQRRVVLTLTSSMSMLDMIPCRSVIGKSIAGSQL
jgi:hypothetical protein